MPSATLWEKGLSVLQTLDVEAFKVVGAACHALFNEQKLLAHLRHERMDAAIVDLFCNECGLAYAHILGNHSLPPATNNNVLNCFTFIT